jgi:hypothetical protein
MGSAAHPPPSGASFGGMSHNAKLMAVGGVVAVLLLVGVAIGTRGSTPEPEAASSVEPPVDSAARTLAEAKALLEKGDIDGALKKAAEIPESSNARQTADYRQIQAAWADALFAKAEATNDPAEKRAYLDQVSRATNVDSVRRKRAAAALVAVGGESVDVNELPSAPKDPPRAVAQAAPRAVNDDPPVDAKPSAPVSAPATLVRKNPFDDDSSESADRSKLLQAKASLQQKVRSGSASDRDLKMLRALCKQLGDASCSN